MPSCKSVSLKLWILFTCAVIWVGQLPGQNFYGSIVVTVNDSTGAPIAGAAATLVNTGTNERRVAETAADGTYRFVNLVPGSYRLDVERPGFKRYTRDRIAVDVEAAVRLDVGMQVGDV